MSFLALKPQGRTLPANAEQRLQRFIECGLPNAVPVGPTGPTVPPDPPPTPSPPAGPGQVINWAAVPGAGSGLVLVTILTAPSAGDAVALGDGLGVITGYFYAVDGGAAQPFPGASGASEALLSLSPGTTVSIAVFARTAVGDGPLSPAISVAVPGVTDPLEHVLSELLLETGGWFQLEDGASEILIEDEISGYVTLYGLDADGTYFAINALRPDGERENIIVKGL